MIEFGLTFPLLLLVLIGISIESGSLFFQQYEVVTNAAREGARIAVLPTYSATPLIRTANVQARVNQYLVASGLTGPATTTVDSAAGAGLHWMRDDSAGNGAIQPFHYFFDANTPQFWQYGPRQHYLAEPVTNANGEFGRNVFLM